MAKLSAFPQSMPGFSGYKIGFLKMSVAVVLSLIVANFTSSCVVVALLSTPYVKIASCFMSHVSNLA